MQDYVIVGGGSAGCVLAARLTEDPDVSVLLLEAGPPDSADTIHIPAAFAKNFRTRIDWDYATAAEPQLNGRRVFLPRGRTLGGSSSLNAMVYIRGNRADYDGWRALGLEGWGYDDLLPYFIRAEDNERGASEYHGAGGPLSVSDGRSRNPLMAAFLAAAQEAGLEANDDFNGARQDGVGEYQCTQRDGKRCSTAVAYLHPALERPNLRVLTEAQVHRVLLDGGRAVGVTGERFGEAIEEHAEREVILCGGAYNSPQLLMLSGIGPAEHLASRQIEVAVDQPAVGENVVDHPATGAVWRTPEPVSLLTAETPENLALFMEEGRGPLTSCLAEAGGFFRSRDGLEAPDLQFHAVPAMFVEEGLVDPPDHGFLIAACLLTPRSRGRLTLASPDPTAKPRIEHRYLSEPEDVAALTSALRTILDVAGQPALARYRGDPYDVPASAGDDDLIHHLRHQVQTLYHPVGTCAMGTVLDGELRVRGVEALRVVDASAMPTITRGNTNAPVIAVAEKAADLIRGVAAPAPRPTAAATAPA